MKRMVSIMLTLVLCLTACPMAMAAETPTTHGLTNEDITIEAEDSFGDLLTGEIEDKLDEQAENNGYNIFSVEMMHTTARVKMEALDDCTLIVGIYDEAGEQMYASGYLDVTREDKQVTVQIETDSMPEYFLVKAFLVNSEDMTPLCTAYTTPNYTKEMQEFFAMTVEDFDADRVLNLDSDPTNNFAVYSEDVKVIPESDTANQVVEADDATQTYVIENADSSVTTLQPGDTFAHTYDDGQVLIVKVKEITVTGTTATIIGDDTDLESVFDYAKIDGTAGLDENSLLETKVSQAIICVPDGKRPPVARGVDIGGSIGKSYMIPFLDEKDEDTGVALNGSLTLGITASCKLYLAGDYQSLELKLDYYAEASVSVSGKADLFKKELAVFAVSPVPGVYIEFTPSFVVEVSAKMEVSGTLEGTIGFAVNTDDGMKNLTKAPSFNPELKGEFTVFVGLSMEPKISIISKYLASAKMSATAGVELKGTIDELEPLDTSKKHDCENCIDGDIHAKFNISFEATLMNNENLKFKLNLLNVQFKICDFYWSADYDEFAFTVCPHIQYRVTINVVDPENRPVSGATVSVNSTDVYTTDQQGQVIFYGYNDVYVTDVYKGNVKARLELIQVKDEARNVTVELDVKSDVVVTDAYNTVVFDDYFSQELLCYHIPEINLSEGLDTSINTKIYSELYTLLEDGVFNGMGDEYYSPSLYKMVYAWGQKDKIISVIVETSMNHAACRQYYVYNISVKTGKATSIGELVSAYGFTEEEFYDVARDTLRKYWDSRSGLISNIGEEQYNTLVERTLAEGNVKAAIPYINSDGKLSIVANIYSPAGAESYLHLLNTTGEVNAEYLECTIEHTIQQTAVLDSDMGGSHSAAVTEDGSLYMWGANNMRQLGTDTNEISVYGETISSTPIPITMPTTASASVEPVFSTLALADGAETAEFADLVPGELYNFYVMADREAESPFSGENLLYIGQGVADANGALAFDYIPTEMVADADIFVAGVMPEPEYIPGDVDASGKIDVADIMKLKALIMADRWTDQEQAVGDMDGSGRLDVGDIMAVKNIIMSN